MKILILLILLGCTDGQLNILNLDLKPVNKIVNTATDLVNDLADFTLNEILNFKSFKSLFKKVYDTLELENIALLNFLINQRDVDDHNRKFQFGQVSYRRAVCEYSDMSTDDMNKYVNRFQMPKMKRNRRNKRVKVVSESEEEMAGNEEVEEEAGVIGGILGPVTDVLFGSRNKNKNSSLKGAKSTAERTAPILKTDELLVPRKQPKEALRPADDFQEYPEDYNIPDYQADYQDSNLPAVDYANELLEQKLTSELKYLSIHAADDLLNYITQGFDTKVLNQGVCGSCWSFSATAAIEAAWYVKTGDIVKLSEQQLIDCNRNKDNDGCDGGNMANAFKFVQYNGGISLSSRYPYKGNDTYRCKNVSPDIEVVDHVLLDPGDEDLLLETLIENGPIAVAIDASLKSFQTYKSGVYYDEKCSDNVNHAMLLVGYGTVKSTNEDYWIIKNTYGTTWGINGYMKLARNRDNHCGITEFAAFPICS